MTDNPQVLRRRTWVTTLGVVAVLVVVAYLLRPEVARLMHQKAGSGGLLGSHPMPTLFTAAAMAPATGRLGAADAHAATLMKRWWRGHGTAPDDAAFLAWLERSFPPPPGGASRGQQATALRPVVARRGPAGKKASVWLRKYGRDKLWVYYAHADGAKHHDRRQLHGLQAALRLSDRAAKSLERRLGQAPPYVLDPQLATKHEARKHTDPAGCPCSYPSAYAATAAAARGLLTLEHPGRAGTYRRMEDEVDYARLYGAEALPSDLDAGTLLGDMVGEYVAVTRQLASVGHAGSVLGRA